MQYRVLGVPSYDGAAGLLRLVGLDGTGKKKVRNFSLGMRQRLGIAVGSGEPVNGLDPQGIIEMRELILKLNRERGITVLISSHILDELSRLATHYGFIDGGRMVKEISAEELERAARKCMSLRVSDTVPLVPVLDRLGAEYTVISGNEVKLYTPMPVCVLSDELSEAGCRLLNVTEQDESLESFYMELLGGERHA